MPKEIEHKVETMFANLSNEISVVPRRRLGDWVQTKTNASRMPIRSSKELELINKLGIDAQKYELQEYQNTLKVFKSLSITYDYDFYIKTKMI